MFVNIEAKSIDIVRTAPSEYPGTVVARLHNGMQQQRMVSKRAVMLVAQSIRLSMLDLSFYAPSVIEASGVAKIWAC